MPSSHGGGGSSSGGGGSHGSGGSRTFSSKHSFPGATKYTYIDRHGAHCYFYSSVIPRRRKLPLLLIGPILSLIFVIVIGSLLATSFFPTKLDSHFCENTNYYIQDDASVFQDTTSLKSVLEAFYEKTGIEPYIYTNTKTYLTGEGFAYSQSGIEDFAYEIYVKTFKDEGHYVVCFVYQDDSNYYWCDMAGDDTQSIITDKLFSIFQGNLQSALIDASTPFESDFENAFTVMTEKALTTEAIDLFTVGITGFIILLFAFFSIGAIVGTIKNNRQINDYLEYTKVNGKDTTYSTDDYGYSKESYNKDDYFN